VSSVYDAFNDIVTRRSGYAALWDASDFRGWNGIRAYVLERDDYRCVYCDREAVHVDHVIPRSVGGQDVVWNLVSACLHCNCSKGAKVLGWALQWERFASDYIAACMDGLTVELEDIAA
jgi:5-methylcytosine-specific restriction endonuclease McrA